MKLIHLSDLHLGKRVHEFSMLEDQKYILDQIIKIIDNEKPDGVIIAGDVYDKTVPPAEAVQLFDSFLVSLSLRNLKVFVISGNHDSAERISFGSRLMDKSGIYLAPVYDGKVEPIVLSDPYGEVNIYMLPFLKPSHVKRFYEEEEITSYTDAISIAVQNMSVNETERNLLITHQFVTGASRCDSEDISVGGSDNVDAAAFKGFDYVALGHLHNPQNVGSNTVRYCGTPLKYSFSEADRKKAVTVVTLCEKGSIFIDTIPLIPKRDLKEIRGTYTEITQRSFYEKTSYREDYVHITLTDEEDIPDAVGKLRTIYHNLMKLDYDNKRTRFHFEILGDDSVEQKTPLELFCEFYEKQNNQPMREEQQSFTSDMIRKIWEDEI
ncbi:exonuclease SbcCD subunit D [Sinanaerobacter sp. ZZT-01]|uniref:exonuclease SbcCD subunit D n=1 Tax=Sinanaerobacter sp. ZZT-01 TaxID=3111540 RepID=UPI002D7A2735|nr:exonuclease SbcCD subunit D [Sinanaerobacter sp. ZZT-01]WRR93188.1 exonuclease SbcCD subunit D [Sinanaerobacter sp. ZZT-01]